nr:MULTISPECIES: hypothetical protein [unclassified Allomuricauda]
MNYKQVCSAKHNKVESEIGILSYMQVMPNIETWQRSAHYLKMHQWKN